MEIALTGVCIGLRNDSKSEKHGANGVNEDKNSEPVVTPLVALDEDDLTLLDSIPEWTIIGPAEALKRQARFYGTKSSIARSLAGNSVPTIR